MSLFDESDKTSLRMVIGLNQVDKMIVGGWDERLNMPTKKAEQEIQRRSNDIIGKLSKVGKVSSSHIEYYSALKRYRLLPLLSKIIRYAYAGFKLDHVHPADPFELADSDVREFATQEREKRKKNNQQKLAKDSFFDEISKILSVDELNMLRKKFTEECQRPPKVAFFGKTGVGKTTTINNLFNAQWKTSHTLVGTTHAQMKEFELSGGGRLMIVDLPGYGRSIAEDREYEKIYQDIIPSCDLIFLVIQADSRDLADDQEMIFKITEWLTKSPLPKQ